MKILGTTQKNSPHKIILHKCVLQYVRTLKLNDATLGKLKYNIQDGVQDGRQKIKSSISS